MGVPPYSDTALHFLSEHLRADATSCAVMRALLTEIQDDDSTDERRQLAARLLKEWQVITCPAYVDAFFGPQGRRKAP